MIIGLTGGIASGKSTVVEMIKEAGYKVIDADQLVHDMPVSYTHLDVYKRQGRYTCIKYLTSRF